MPFALINKMTVKRGNREKVIKILLESGKRFDDNTACKIYLVNKDTNDPNVIWVEDVWTSQDDHAAALNTPEMRAYIATCMPLLDGMPEQIAVELVGGKSL